jgi:hypothetical protein
MGDILLIKKVLFFFWKIIVRLVVILEDANIRSQELDRRQDASNPYSYQLIQSIRVVYHVQKVTSFCSLQWCITGETIHKPEVRCVRQPHVNVAAKADDNDQIRLNHHPVRYIFIPSSINFFVFQHVKNGSVLRKLWRIQEGPF